MGIQKNLFIKTYIMQLYFKKLNLITILVTNFL
jgi:hypothetical protein